MVYDNNNNIMYIILLENTVLILIVILYISQVKAVLEKQINPITNFRGSFIDTGIFNTTGVVATVEVNGLQWRDLQWDAFAGSNINIGGTFFMVEVRDGVVFPNNGESM